MNDDGEDRECTNAGNDRCNPLSRTRFRRRFCGELLKLMLSLGKSAGNCHCHSPSCVPVSRVVCRNARSSGMAESVVGDGCRYKTSSSGFSGFLGGHAQDTTSAKALKYGFMLNDSILKPTH